MTTSTWDGLCPPTRSMTLDTGADTHMPAPRPRPRPKREGPAASAYDTLELIPNA